MPASRKEPLVKDLKDLARKHEIRGFSNKNKTQLISLLRKAQVLNFDRKTGISRIGESKRASTVGKRVTKKSPAIKNKTSTRRKSPSPKRRIIVSKKKTTTSSKKNKKATSYEYNSESSGFEDGNISDLLRSARMGALSHDILDWKIFSQDGTKIKAGNTTESLEKWLERSGHPVGHP